MATEMTVQCKQDIAAALEAYWQHVRDDDDSFGLFYSTIKLESDSRVDGGDEYWSYMAVKSTYPNAEFVHNSMRLMIEIERVGLQASPLRQTLLESLEIHLEALSKMQEAIKVANEMMKP